VTIWPRKHKRKTPSQAFTRSKQINRFGRSLKFCGTVHRQNKKYVSIVVIRNSVLNGKPQLIEGDKQRWPISFYWKSHTVTLNRRRINILLVECDLHNGKSLFVPLAKLGFPINYEFRIKSIVSHSWLLCESSQSFKDLETRTSEHRDAG